MHKKLDVLVAAIRSRGNDIPRFFRHLHKKDRAKDGKEEAKKRRKMSHKEGQNLEYLGLCIDKVLQNQGLSLDGGKGCAFCYT